MSVGSGAETRIEVGLLTGGGDRPYACGLAQALIAEGVRVDLIGSDDVDCRELERSSNLKVLNLRGNQSEAASFARKVLRVGVYYARLVHYGWTAKPKVFHILWNNKVEVFDRTVLMLYYKLAGRKIALTAHNVNAGRRDGQDSFLNRLTLRMQYRLARHIFVHTEKMKSELQHEFGVPGRVVSVIPFGVNEHVPNTELTPAEAKKRLGISPGERTMLCFGSIAPYKGLEFLIKAFEKVVEGPGKYRLIVAGKPRGGSEDYAEAMQRMMDGERIRERVIRRIEYIPDPHIELYFKAADVLVLPYKDISQSGVLFLAYGFGLPVIATDVGSLKDSLIEGRTGVVCKPRDAGALATAIEEYFGSDLFRELRVRRNDIQSYAKEQNSWGIVGKVTRGVYVDLLSGARDEAVE